MRAEFIFWSLLLRPYTRNAIIILTTKYPKYSRNVKRMSHFSYIGSKRSCHIMMHALGILTEGHSI